MSESFTLLARAEILDDPVSTENTNALAENAHRIIRGYQFLNDNQLSEQETLSPHLQRFIRGQAGLQTSAQFLEQSVYLAHPCHCTEFRGIALLADAFGVRFLEIYTSRRFEI